MLPTGVKAWCRDTVIDTSVTESSYNDWAWPYFSQWLSLQGECVVLICVCECSIILPGSITSGIHASICRVDLAKSIPS